MKTDDLITMLAQDAAPPPAAPLGRRVALGLALGCVVALALYGLALGPRPLLMDYWQDPLVLAKTLLPLALFAFALPLGLRAVRPGAAPGVAARAIWVVPVVLGGLVVWTLFTTPRGELFWDWIGHSIPVCLPAITVLSLPILAGLITALRRGAPVDPQAAGALAGLAAAGLATALYSTFCTEDSPLFYATWYTVGIMFTAGLGAWAGGKWLRW
ncbi:NrsF family protein [Pseudooceanicola sp.]|uniref:NrsF family protein n=1 Tax=Pseudooceanicola sp. TaxID=1914328 RepID=UPI0035C712A7